LAAKSVQPKPVTPVENQLLQLRSLAEEMQNELHLIIDPLMPILNHDPREPAPDTAVPAEDYSCQLEAQIIGIKDHFRANLYRLREINGAIRL